MNPSREIIFNLLCNASLQIGFFTLITAVFSRVIAKVKAQYQHLVYIVVFIFCLAVPVVDTFWQSHPVAVAAQTPQQASSQFEGANSRFWRWKAVSRKHRQFTITPQIETWIIAVWALFIVYRLIRFSRGVHRVHRLRREATVLSLATAGIVSRIIDAGHKVALLESADIDVPVTVGVFHPAILLPSKMLPSLTEQDFSAIFAHEYGHIRRRDFLAHVLCELISLPVSWHPGIRYLISKISQTRELACDDYAASRLGKRRMHARTLLRLASLCLHTSRDSTVALGIFDGDNLETRIMMLTEKKLSLSRAGVVALTLAMSLPFGAGVVLARAMSLQTGSASSNSTQTFAGTWHWMFNGKSFATMVLVRNGSAFTGSVTGSRIALKDDGGLSRADPSENSAPVPIAKAELEGSALHVTVIDDNQPFAFLVTLKDETHAEIHPVGAPPNMKPIPAEKVH